MDITQRDIIKLINDAEVNGLLHIGDAAHFERLCQRLTVDAAFREKLCEQLKQKIKEQQESIKRHTPQPTQKEQREAKRKQRQAELERAKLTQDNILTNCAANGEFKVTVEGLKNAFPKMISQIDGNSFRTNIDNIPFKEFLLSNDLTFTLPDFVFKKRA